MKIELKDIKVLCNILVDKAISSGFNEIEISADNYWTIASDEREDFNKETPDICVGSLIDDYESLLCVLRGTNISTPVDFDRLASVITAIGETITCSDKVY